MDDLQQTLLLTELYEMPIQRVLALALLFPGQIILLGRFDGPITQPLGIVACHDQLHSREERLENSCLDRAAYADAEIHHSDLDFIRI